MTETALITGCTSGIGKAFVHLLAKEGYDLILVSRNAEKLEELAKSLTYDYGIKTHSIACDLKKAGAAAQVYQRTKNLKLQVQLLINNAGFNEFGPFLETDPAKELDMMHLHMIFTTQMMKLFLPPMVAHRSGRILNVGSTGSYIACPYDAVYAATKAYILSLSKGIRAELKGTGVSVTVLCPGSTKTGFAGKAGMEDTLLFKRFVMNPERVARIGYRALMKRKESVIAGLYNKLLVFSSYLLPNAFVNFLSKKMLQTNRKGNF